MNKSEKKPKKWKIMKIKNAHFNQRLIKKLNNIVN